MREEQEIMRGEALKLQGRAETSRHRAHERCPNRSKEQVWIRRLHATLAVSYSEALRAAVDSKVTVATRVGLKALGLTGDNPKTSPNLSQLGIPSASGNQESASPTVEVGRGPSKGRQTKAR